MQRRSGQASECSARSTYLLDGRRVPSPVVRTTEPAARRTGRSERPAIANTRLGTRANRRSARSLRAPQGLINDCSRYRQHTGESIDIRMRNALYSTGMSEHRGGSDLVSVVECVVRDCSSGSGALSAVTRRCRVAASVRSARIDICCRRPVRVLSPAGQPRPVCMSARWRCGLLCRPAGYHADAGGFEDPWLVQGELGDQGMVRCRPEFGGGQQRTGLGHLVARRG